MMRTTTAWMGMMSKATERMNPVRAWSRTGRGSNADAPWRYVPRNFLGLRCTPWRTSPEPTGWSGPALGPRLERHVEVALVPDRTCHCRLLRGQTDRWVIHCWLFCSNAHWGHSSSSPLLLLDKYRPLQLHPTFKPFSNMCHLSVSSKASSERQ